jgi:hypothetical protein
MFSFFRKSGPPNAGAVLKRAVILKYLIVKMMATPPEEFLADCRSRWSEEEWKNFQSMAKSQSEGMAKQLRESGLWRDMDRSEQDLMMAGLDVTERQHIDASWLAESVFCLLWSLGYVPEILPYDRQADPEVMKKLPSGNLTTAIRDLRLRDLVVIEKQRDIAELWHWRSRTRRLQEEGRMPALVGGKYTVEQLLRMTSSEAAKAGDIPTPIGEDFPAFGKPYRDLTREEFASATSIAQERHRAFNWLCGLAPGNRWSETPTDT